MEIGTKLKEARENKGLTLKEIEQETKIRKKYLQAIEDNRFDIIPGEVYVKVFIKGYANQVGLNGEEISREYQAMLDQLKKEEEEAELLEEEENSQEKVGSLLQNNLLNIAIAVVVTLVVVVIVFNVFLLNNSGDTLETLSPESSQEQQLDNNSAVDTTLPEGIRVENPPAPIVNENKETNVEVQAVEPVTAEPAKEILKVIAVEKSWVQVMVDGKQAYQGFINKGEILEYSGQDTLSLKIGNGNAIKVEKGNQVFGPWGEKGQVVKKEINF